MTVVAVESFANTVSGYLTPVLLVVVMSMIAYQANIMRSRQDKAETESDELSDKLHTLTTEVALLTRQVQDSTVVQASHSAGIAKLTESAIQLNVTVSDHVKWHEQRYGPRPR